VKGKPAPAAGKTEARPEKAAKKQPPKKAEKKQKPAPPPVKWDWHPSLSTGTAYDQTVVPRVGNTREPVDTFVSYISPGLQFRRQRGPNYQDLQYRFDARFYEEMPERDSLSHGLSFLWNERPSANWGWRFSDRFLYLQDTGGQADEAITRLTTYYSNTIQLDGDAALAEKWKLLSGMGYEIREYDDPIRADWYTLAPEWGVEWRANGDRYSLRHEFKYLDIEEGVDEETHRVLAGYATELPLKLRLDLRAGILYFRSTDNVDPAAYVRLFRSWGKVRASLGYERSASVSTGSYLVVRRDYASFVPSWSVAKNTTLSGSVTWLYQKSMASDLTDIVTWRSGVAVNQQFTKWLSGNLAYTYVDQTSDGRSGLTLHGSIISAGITARY